MNKYSMACKGNFVITGGIGSGKTFICNALTKLSGIQVYDCDSAAKKILLSSVNLQNKLKQLIGDVVIVDGKVNKSLVSKFILASDKNRIAVNDIIHPAVANDFKKSGYSWMECAIYFDSGFDKLVKANAVICVTAPLETRIDRIRKRNNVSREVALQWMAKQLPQDEVERRSQYIIHNNGVENVEAQIISILHEIEKE